MDLQLAYNNLLRDPLFAFVVLPSGAVKIIQGAKGPFNHPFIHVYPGSYNPVTEAHKAVFDAIDTSPDNKFFEISIERMNKEFLHLDATPTPEARLNSLSARLKQFVDWAGVIVTRAPRFIEKAGLLHYFNPTFHIGADTVLRMFDDYGIAGAQGIAAKFVVYDRKIGSEIITLENLNQVPMNFTRGKTVNESLLGVSSSSIRSEWKNVL